MTNDDPRRVKIAEAMGARRGIFLRVAQDAAYDALPLAVELIDELTAAERYHDAELVSVRRRVDELTAEVERLRREAKQMEGRIERSNLVLSPNGQMLMPKRGDWSITSDLIARAEAAEAEVERLRKYIKATAPSKSEAKRVIGMCGGGR